MMKKMLGLLLVVATGVFPVGSGLEFGPGKGAPGEEDTGGGEDGVPPGDNGGGEVALPVRLGKGLGAGVG